MELNNREEDHYEDLSQFTQGDERQCVAMELSYREETHYDDADHIKQGFELSENPAYLSCSGLTYVEQ